MNRERDTDSKMESGQGDRSKLSTQIEAIFDQVKLQLPTIDFSCDSSSEEEDGGVFQRSQSQDNTQYAACGGEEWDRIFKDQANESEASSVAMATDSSIWTSIPSTTQGPSAASSTSQVDKKSSGTSTSTDPPGGTTSFTAGFLEQFDSLFRESTSNLQTCDPSRTDSLTSNSTNCVTEEVRFSEGFLDRVEAAVLNKDSVVSYLDLGEVDLEAEHVEIQQQPWENIHFTEGFLQKVDAEFFATRNRDDIQVVDLDLEDYDLCDLEVPSGGAAGALEDALSSTSSDRELESLMFGFSVGLPKNKNMDKNARGWDNRDDLDGPSRSNERSTEVWNLSRPERITQQQLQSQQVISRYFSLQPTTLAESLQDINIDELLQNEMNRAEDSNILASSENSSLFLPIHPERGEGSSDACLLEQLARLSASQSGVDLGRIDPRSGASQPQPYTKQQKTERNLRKARGPTPSDLANRPRVQTERRQNNPETVYLDLRNFDLEQQKQEESFKAVERILRYTNTQQESSSDDSEGEEANSTLWHEQRRLIKAALAKGQPISLNKHKAGRPNLGDAHLKPPRLLHMKPKTLTTSGGTLENTVHTASKSASTASNVTAELLTAADSSPETGDADKTLQDIANRREPSQSDMAEQRKKLFEKKRQEHQSKIRLYERLNKLKPSLSSRGYHQAAEATPTIYDTEASYEPQPSTLPPDAHSNTEVVLLAVKLSSCGEMVAHHKSVDAGSGLSASCVALLSWLLSLVPDNFDFLSGQGQQCYKNVVAPAPFQIIGLQQCFLQEQLSLYIAVCPVEGSTFKSPTHRAKKTKLKDEVKDISAFQQVLNKFLSTNTLQSVCYWLGDLVPFPIKGSDSDSFTYSSPLPTITNRPLSTFMQVNPDPQAAFKVFGTEVSFYWETVDTEESSCDLDVQNDNPDTQNTMSLLYKHVYRDPRCMMGVLNRLLQEGLDLSGVRLLYPYTLSTQTAVEHKPTHPQASLQVSPVVVIAIRGKAARRVWLDIVGPSDPVLARRTDPHSLCALYGGASREESLLFVPRNPSRVLYELALWFGPRVPPSGVVNVGLPSSGIRKGKKADGGEEDVTVVRPASTLIATISSDIILTVSPVVATSWLGLLLGICQKRGYQLRGIRRLVLTPRKVAALGIGQEHSKAFAGELEEFVNSDYAPLYRGRPAALLLLHRENASHHMSSLIQAFMVKLTLEGHLGALQKRILNPVGCDILFKAVAYSDSLLSSLGGSFSKVGEVEVASIPGYIAPQLHSNPELEQVVVLTLTGHSQMDRLSGLLDVLISPRHEAIELVGIKWLPSLSSTQAKEVTPFEVGDKLWRQSIQTLTSRPAVVLVLRGVNGFVRVQKHINVKETPSLETSLQYLMSLNADIAFHQVRLFFTDRELFPDAEARTMLPYLPPPRQLNDSHCRSGYGKVHAGREEVEESILAGMLEGPRLITTVLIIKPDAMRHLGKIMRKITQEDFKVVAMRQEVLTRSAVKSFLCDSITQAALREVHISHMTGAPSMLLCLQRENAVKHLVDLLGPQDPREACRLDKGYWRGLYGTDPVCNGLHGSEDYRSAVREQRLVFPEGLCCQPSYDLQQDGIPCPAVDSIICNQDDRLRDAVIQATDTRDSQPVVSSTRSSCQGTVTGLHISSLTQTNCIVLTPTLLSPPSRSVRRPPYINLIEQLLNKGCELVGGRMVWLTETQAQTFLHVINAGSYQMAPLLTSGPSLILAVQNDNAILTFDALLGSDFDKESLYSKYNLSILRAKDAAMAGRMLAFFFDELMPEAQVKICSRS